MNVVAMVTEINMFFRLGNSEELICSIAMSWDGEELVNYELESLQWMFLPDQLRS